MRTSIQYAVAMILMFSPSESVRIRKADVKKCISRKYNMKNFLGWDDCTSNVHTPANRLQLYGTQQEYFYAEVKVGNGTYRLILDTTSSDVWLRGSKCQLKQCQGKPVYEPSDVAVDLKKPFKIEYFEGSFEGQVFQDNLSFGKYVVKNQEFGVVDQLSERFADIEADGIMGLAFTSQSYIGVDPPLVSLMKEQVFSGIFTLFFDRDKEVGELVFDHEAESLRKWNVYPDPLFFEFPLLSFDYGSQSFIQEKSVGVIATAVNGIYGPPSVMQRLNSKIGADQEGNVSCDLKGLETIKIRIDRYDFYIKPEEYIFRTGNQCKAHFVDSVIQNFYVLGGPLVNNRGVTFNLKDQSVGVSQLRGRVLYGPEM